VIYLLTAAMLSFSAMMNVNEKGCGLVIAQNATIYWAISGFIVALAVAIICDDDHMDKTINYEILSGHSRFSIFMARSLFAVFFAAAAATLINFVPLLSGTMLKGFGDMVVLKDVIVRQLMCFFPYLRLAAFFTVICFIIKNSYVVIAAGFLISEIGMALVDILDHGKSLYTSIFNIGLLGDFSAWVIYNLDPVNGIAYYGRYKSELDKSVIVGTILVSLIMTIFYLFMGYGIFRRDDLD
jgi:hypothetical protein